MALSVPRVSVSLSSAEPAPQWNHDVYVSCSGKDTRYRFISHLYDELQNAGIKAFCDVNRLEMGDDISQSICRALEESRFAIVVLSENYASSRWCLDELTKILQGMEGENILPLFYHSDPYNVRNHEGSFAEAFAEHEKRFAMHENHRLHQWRDALRRVACLDGGLQSNNYKSDREFVEHIVELMRSKVRPDEETRQAMGRTSEPAPRWNYDVFLSFRGKDTRRGFLSHLYDALQNTKVIKTFKDDEELVKGKDISPSLLEAIEESSFAVVLLSSNYASSTWCLEELTKIFECMEGKDKILPIFYNVDPSDVRHQLNSFEKAFKKHVERVHDKKKVEQWRIVLRKVANLSGWHSGNYEDESQLVKHVVELVRSKVTREAIARTSESALRWKHDVFLSFKHQDTSKDFISHLYHELQHKRGIRTFNNNEQLVKTMAITPNLLMAIEESRFAIVVISKNYASSTWCLDELSKIFQCMKSKGSVLPIFYGVEPSYDQLKSALTEHEKFGHDTEKLEQWRVALAKLVVLPRWVSNAYRSERDIIKEIADNLRPISIMSTIDFEAFEATRQAMEEVMNALKDDDVTIVGVYGMAGVGKTTMVKHVAAQAQKNGTFDHVIMVVVSQNFDLIKIQGTLADLLGMELAGGTKYERAERLHRLMTGVNNILIILDDIWEKIEFSSIGFPSSKSERQKCRSKILLTTRLLNVCDSMESEANITLNFLSEEDSWKFFLKKSGKTIHESSVFYNVARKVVRECGGLPNALKAVARGLGDKHLGEWNGEWNEAALQLKPSQLNVFKSIKLSYHSLIGHDAKSCFLLCCLFPEGDDIQITDLIKYGFGKGLFHDADTIEKVRDQATSVVQYLKACSLLLNGTKEGCVRIHNVVRDVAMSIALSKDGRHLVKAGCELEDWPMDAHEGYSAISLMKNKIHKLPEKLVCPELQILLLQSNAGICEIPESFFQSLNALEVLDLSDTSISLLTLSFTPLNNLQALYLDYCKNLTNISMIGNIYDLKILSMRESSLKELPKELGQLTNLRMLDITNKCLHSVPSKVISRLDRLEELYLQYNFKDWGSTVERAGVGLSWFTNAGFDELTGLPRLKILKVCISDTKCLHQIVGCNPHWMKYDICINRQGSKRTFTLEHDFPHHNSRSLTLDTTISTLPNWFINMVTTTTETLRYLECKGLNNILDEYDQGSLDGLKYLAIIGPHEKLEKLMNAATLVSNKPVFKSLEELHLFEVNCLKKLCVGQLPTGSLCKLKLLKVECCHNLVNTLLPSDLLQGLQNLEELICSNMDRLGLVFGPEWLQPQQRYPGPHAISNNLKLLVLSRCAQLKYLFTSNVAQCFSQLEDLWVDRCDSLDRVIEEGQEAVNHKIVFLKLKNLVLMDLPQLIWFFTRSATIECPLLEHLHIEDCPQFLTPAYEFHSRKQVQLNDVQHWWSLKKRLWKDVEDSL